MKNHTVGAVPEAGRGRYVGGVVLQYSGDSIIDPPPTPPLYIREGIEGWVKS